ncbi:MAG: hypothetical protein LCH20_04430 [Proteobacteria bacterium]|nr:hypothetical protein [Pseudomonadota bacterium]
MSGQILELIIFAEIAFWIISKLISTFGTTSDDDPMKNKSFFGEQGQMKDVTDSGNVVNNKKRAADILKPLFANKTKVDLSSYIVSDNEPDIKQGLNDVLSRIPTFNIQNFIKGAKAAFKMIIEAANTKNDTELGELVDKRYIEHFKAMANSYGDYQSDPTLKVSEIYMFGNNVFIKILFAGKNITKKIKNMHEEWTFTKSANNNGNEWFLTNIDRPQ